MRLMVVHTAKRSEPIKSDTCQTFRAGSGNLDSGDKWNFCLTSTPHRSSKRPSSFYNATEIDHVSISYTH
jgi:hypothetical protein